MKSNLRKVLRTIIKESIKKEIKKTIVEKYKAGDTMLGSLSDIVSNFEIEDFPEEQYEKNYDLDANVNDYKNNETDENNETDAKQVASQEDTAEVMTYYDNNYSKTVSLIKESVTVVESPDLKDMFGNISKEEQKIYDENHAAAKRAASGTLTRIQADTEVQDALYTASNLCKIPLTTLYSLVAIESGGNQRAKSPSGNHFGLFQFGDSAAKGSGFNGKNDIYNSSRHSYKYKLNNSVAACNFMKKNHSYGISKSIGLSTYSAYLMHQQGAAGSNTIYSNFNNANPGLIRNQRSNISSIKHDNLAIDTNRKWMIGWLGRIKGFEDSFNNVSGGQIRAPQNNLYQILGQVPASNTVPQATWKNSQPGTTLGRGINFDKTFDNNKNNYRAGLSAEKYNYNKAFFNEIEKDYNIENVVTMLAASEGGRQISGAVKSAGLKSYYYEIGHPDELQKEQIQEIFGVIKKGNTLIHCNHGADRTGSILGAYYLNENLMDYDSAKWDHMEYQGKPREDPIVVRNLNFIRQYKQDGSQ